LQSSTLIRWAAAHYRLSRGATRRNRQTLFGGAFGLRILLFHRTGAQELPGFQRLIRWCQARFEIVGPEVLASLELQNGSPADRDQLLLTFDDGYADQFIGGQWLAAQGIRALYCVSPPFLGRSTDEFVGHHARQGVHAYPLGIKSPGRGCGMTVAQLRELDRLGHEVAAHNYAHRDLGQLTRLEDLDYEIGRALDDLSETLNKPCVDFAISFGTPRHVSAEALDYLQVRCRRVLFSVRGLNVPGRSPACLTRDAIKGTGPEAFNRAAALGAFDDLGNRDRVELIRRGGLLSAVPSQYTPA
jgi:peptidoglycan/xylan/chitin deacetylase (PgdA/CDA1 family)